MKITLRDAAEEQAGIAFSNEEYQTALSAARRKLECVCRLNGTRYGESYLAVLIAEAVSANRLTQYLDAVWELRELACQGGGPQATYS